MRLALLLLAASVCFAGSSLTITGTQEASAAAVPAQGANDPCQVEFNIADWDATPVTGTIVRAFACGLRLEFNSTFFQFYGDRDAPWITSTDGSADPILIPISVFTDKFAHWRLEKVPDGAGGLVTIEGWDSTGTRVAYEYYTYTGTSGTNSNGITLYAPGSETMTFAFVRLSTTTVGAGARFPVYWPVGGLGDWKLDSTLDDGSAGNNDFTLSSGSPSYGATAYQTIITSRAVMTPIPTWAPDWIAAAVGTSFTLDCSKAGHWGDAQGTETYLWTVQATTGATPTFGTSTAVSTTVSGHNRSSLTFRCAYSATSMGTANDDLQMGAVGMDANGVINDLSTEITDLFGPMIAFGKNPWGSMDERAYAMLTARAAQLRGVHTFEPYNSYPWSNPSWNNNQTGTIAYTFNGKGAAGGGSGTGTTITEDLTDTELDIDVADAGFLQLTTLPTRIFIRTGNGQEEIRICSASATDGAATLTVCYDGRGYSPDSSVSQSTNWLARQAWSTGATVGQFEIIGTSTDFVGTTENYMCYAAPGPAGPMVYNTGTVDPAPGSASLTGSGTAWTGIGALETGQKYLIRIQGTHSTGTAFVFVSPIVFTADGTATLSRVYPADADGAGADTLTYQIIYPFYRDIALHFDRQDFLAMGDTADVSIAYRSTGCESDTQIYSSWGLSPGSVAGVNGTALSSKAWSFVDGNGYVNSNGLGSANFYGEGLAQYVSWLRSSYLPFYTAAQEISYPWPKYPPLHGATDASLGTLILSAGGGVINSIACIVADPSCPYDMSLVRGYAQMGVNLGASLDCTNSETRDAGYRLGWLSLMAHHDPDATFQTQWRAGLVDFYQRDLACKRSDNSWKNSFYWNNSGPTVSMTNASATVTGTGLTAGYCHGLEKGTITATNGSASLTGASVSISASADGMLLRGTKASAEHKVFVAFSRTSSSAGSISLLWDGDSGTVEFTSANQDGNDLIVFGTSNADTDLQYHYLCIHVSSTEWTLDRPWEGNTASHEAYGPENDLGFTQQWFMLGIYTQAMRWAALSDAAIGGGQDYANLAGLAAQTLMATAYDANTKGMRYNFTPLDPGTYTAAGTFGYTIPGFVYGLGDISAARTLNGEVSPALVSYMTANGNSSAARTAGDAVYGALWGVCALTTDGFPCDDVEIGTQSNASALVGKWPGFFFGMGFAHQWPAARLAAANGGVRFSGTAQTSGTARTTGN